MQRWHPRRHPEAHKARLRQLAGEIVVSLKLWTYRAGSMSAHSPVRDAGQQSLVVVEGVVADVRFVDILVP